jgi:hypothetical protein
MAHEVCKRNIIKQGIYKKEIKLQEIDKKVVICLNFFNDITPVIPNYEFSIETD